MCLAKPFHCVPVVLGGPPIPGRENESGGWLILQGLYQHAVFNRPAFRYLGADAMASRHLKKVK